MSTRNETLRKKARQLIRRAQVYLHWEQYSPIFAKAALLLGFFLIGSFGGLWQWIGDPWRLILLIAAFIYLGLAFYKASKIKRPSQSMAMRRVENDSEISHRPLDTLFDKPALSEAGWAEHYTRAENKVEQLNRPLLRPVLALIDKYYLRYIVPVLLLLSLMVGTGDSFERLRHSLKPGWIHGAMGDQVTFEAWIDPPEYTGRPPVYFKNTDELEVPEGSELVARIIGTKSPTRLKISSRSGSRHLALNRIGPESFEARTLVENPSKASWRIGQIRKDWTVKTLPDQVPVIEFVREPDADKRDRLIFAYSVNDDYGIEKLTLRLTLLQDDAAAPEKVTDVNVPLSGTIRKTDEKAAALDLTKHEWAGKKVSAVLIGTDGLGQQGQTDLAYFTVPDKIFIEPLAKAVIEQRGLILEANGNLNAGNYESLPRLTRKQWRNRPWFDTWEPEFRLERAPEQIQQAAILIDAITDVPEKMYEDPVVYLGLRNVAARLRYASAHIELDGLPEELWNIAVRAEFGVLGTALQEMREAEAALRDGIARRAPQREIDTLFDRYNEAVDRYREELLREAIENGQTAEEQAGGGGGGGFNLDEIQALLDAIEEANRLGDSEGARRALAQLAELLENMEIQLSQGGGGSGGAPLQGEMSEETREALEDLADLLGDQRELRDETREAEQAERRGEEAGEEEEAGNQRGQRRQGEQPGGDSRSGGNSDQDPISGEQLAEMQRQLSELLENSERFLPTPGEEGEEEGSAGGEGEEEGIGVDPETALEEARRAMELAEEALERGDFGAAESEQGEAIQALREIGRALAEQARRENGRSNANGEEVNNDNSDPIGRNDDSEGGQLADDSADLEGRDPAARTRELQNEIRRRAGEQEREKEELDYLERLLKRF